jgi:hypothetical protein
MTQRLQEVISLLSNMPERDQDAYADWLMEELASEKRWEEAFARSPDTLAKLAEEALREYREGKTLPLDPDQL